MEPRWDMGWTEEGNIRFVGGTANADLWLCSPMFLTGDYRVRIVMDATYENWGWADWHRGALVDGPNESNIEERYNAEKDTIETYLRLFVPELNEGE